LAWPRMIRLQSGQKSCHQTPAVAAVRSE
jgi:hypothetical protein